VLHLVEGLVAEEGLQMHQPLARARPHCGADVKAPWQGELLHGLVITQDLKDHTVAWLPLEAALQQSQHSQLAVWFRSGPDDAVIAGVAYLLPVSSLLCSHLFSAGAKPLSPSSTYSGTKLKATCITGFPVNLSILNICPLKSFTGPLHAGKGV